MAEALLKTPPFVDGTTKPPKIYAVFLDHENVHFPIEEVRYNDEKQCIELLMK